MKQPTPQSFIPSLDTYIGGKRAIHGHDGPIIKLSSNENPLGPSPRAIEAFRRSADALNRYPEDGALALRETISKKFGFAPDQLICGAGSDDILRMLCHAYGGPNRSIIYSAHGFAMYRIYAMHSGAEAISAPEQNLTTDIDAILGTVRPDTSLVFLANPNNPTGTYLPAATVRALRDQLPESLILVLDGAYAEYPQEADYSDGRELVENSNTVITRTFSKAYGLSTLRVGWAYGPKPIIETLYKVRSPFNITQPSIDAAIAALDDQEYIRSHIATNNQERARLAEAMTAMGLTVHPGTANFLLASFASPDEAQRINQYLANKGIIVRAVNNYGLPESLRISIGTASENDALLRALEARPS